MDTSQIPNKLFTKEDPFHVHKTLGALAIVSFATRVVYVGNDDMGFQTFPAWCTVATIALHMTLSLSSLIFQIPSRRIKEGNRIWPQFRWHSICFTARHSAIILLYWAERYLLHEQHQYFWANYAIVFVTFLGVDFANANVRHTSNSVRDLQAHPFAKFFFSALQFAATAMTLMGVRRSSIHYYIIFVMQFSAFVSTLRRKNVVVGDAGRRSLVFGYGVLLAIGSLLTLKEYSQISDVHTMNLTMLAGRTAYLIRVGGPEWLGILKSKYVLWGMAAAFVHVTRPFGTQPHPIGVWLAEEPQRQIVGFINAAHLIVFFLYGYVVSKRQLKEQSDTTNTMGRVKAA